MTKEAHVTFTRTLVLTEVDGLTEDEIRAQAVETWNEEMEMGDIMMAEEHISAVEVLVEETEINISVRAASNVLLCYTPMHNGVRSVLTKGREYKISEETDMDYTIINDEGDKHTFTKKTNDGESYKIWFELKA